MQRIFGAILLQLRDGAHQRQHLKATKARATFRHVCGEPDSYRNQTFRQLAFQEVFEPRSFFSHYLALEMNRRAKGSRKCDESHSRCRQMQR